MPTRRWFVSRMVATRERREPQSPWHCAAIGSTRGLAAGRITPRYCRRPKGEQYARSSLLPRRTNRRCETESRVAWRSVGWRVARAGRLYGTWSLRGSPTCSRTSGSTQLASPPRASDAAPLQTPPLAGTAGRRWHERAPRGVALQHDPAVSSASHQARPDAAALPLAPARRAARHSAPRLTPDKPRPLRQAGFGAVLPALTTN